MIFWHAIWLGIIEGLTEFLPVSSTFHLIWTARIFQLPATDFQKLFEVVIQAGAILAVLVSFLKVFKQERQLFLKVVISFIPTAIVGLLLYKMIKNVFFENYLLQILVFGIVGIVFLWFEKYRGRESLAREACSITVKEAVLVGLMQSLAVVPGVSRAGAVMLIMMFLNVKRDEAARYSFLLAVPTILAASVLDLYKARHTAVSSHDWLMLAIGFIAAYLTALVIVKWFIGFLQKHTISVFGWYRIGLALVLLLFMLFR